MGKVVVKNVSIIAEGKEEHRDDRDDINHHLKIQVTTSDKEVN